MTHIERVQAAIATVVDQADELRRLREERDELEQKLHKERLLHPRSDGEWAGLMLRAEAAEHALAEMRKAVALSIEDILLMDSPEGDSPRNIAANLRAALPTSEDSA